MNQPTMRLIVVGVIQNERDEVLICKMPADRGVFPGQWGLPGGGVEDGESVELALRRELSEEVSLPVTDIQPLFFTDGLYTKAFPGGSQREIYMVFLLLSCRAAGNDVHLIDEFETYAWVKPGRVKDFDLNVETRKAFERLGWL